MLKILFNVFTAREAPENIYSLSDIVNFLSRAILMKFQHHFCSPKHQRIQTSLQIPLLYVLFIVWEVVISFYNLSLFLLTQ